MQNERVFVDAGVAESKRCSPDLSSDRRYNLGRAVIRGHLERDFEAERERDYPVSAKERRVRALILAVIAVFAIWAGQAGSAQAQGYRQFAPAYQAYRFGNRVYQYGLERQGRGNLYAPIGSPQFFRNNFPNPYPDYGWVSRNTYGVFGRPQPCYWC